MIAFFSCLIKQLNNRIRKYKIICVKTPFYLGFLNGNLKKTPFQRKRKRKEKDKFIPRKRNGNRAATTFFVLKWWRGGWDFVQSRIRLLEK